MWAYFNRSEFDCKCGCGHNNIDGGFVGKLDHARDIAGIPFRITSGCRCPAHNAAVTTAKGPSPHLSGHAADILAETSAARWAIVNAAIEIGFTRIGIGRNFIHLDDNPTSTPQVMWLY